MAYVDIVTALALVQFLAFGYRVGNARTKYGVKAPAISGNDVFERHFRVQSNTLEQLVVFLPALYLFCRYWNPGAGAGLGVVYLIGREIYAAAYVRNPARRGLGFALTVLPTMILAAGALVGAVRKLLAH